MGCDIHISVQVKRNGQWENVDVPERLEDRSYPRFSFLTGGKVRPYDNVPSLLPKPRGFPDDFSLGDVYWLGEAHNRSWFLLSELLAVDYNIKFNPHNPELPHRFEDEEITLGEVLGQGWFDSLDQLKSYGNPGDVRIIFAFDN